MKTTHKLDTYKEGWQRVEFCTVCGKEGLELNEGCFIRCPKCNSFSGNDWKQCGNGPCPMRDKKDETQLELFVDN